MSNNEIKKITFEWLKSKGFEKGGDDYKSFGNCYIYSLSKFDIYIIFNKDRFSESYFFEIGFKVKDILNGWGHVRARVPKSVSCTTADKNGIYGYNYEEWSEQDYKNCLEKMYDIYIVPYLKQGIEMLKTIIKNPTSAGGQFGVTKDTPYIIHRNAIEEILKW